MPFKVIKVLTTMISIFPEYFKLFSPLANWHFWVGKVTLAWRISPKVINTKEKTYDQNCIFNIILTQ